MSISKPTAIQRAALPNLLSTVSEDTSSRDIFIQSQTGSGKTLSFLLPIIQDLLPLSSLSYIDRSIGTLAIIIAPTRELAKQISDVLEALLQMRLRPADESPDDPASGPRLTRWLVSGLLTGGSTRTHEKARLRKGVPILVSTPGRLLDHLQNTASFNAGKCRWLVLDEADRLMELGFEETITGIIRGLDGRQKLAKQAVDEGTSMEVGGWDWDKRRRTVLCSATIKEDVQKLAGTTLINPIVIKALQNETIDKPVDPSRPAGDIIAESLAGNTKFTPPSQLSQKYVVVPLKLRLVTLIALLRNLLAQSHGKRTTKIIVFLSCTDSVDFHWGLLGGSSMGGDDSKSEEGSDSGDSDEDDDEDEDEADKPKKAAANIVEVKSALLPETSIFRLHGSLPLQTRQASLKAFAALPSAKNSALTSSILLCTSVASRGLDLPLVRAVIQYDLPTEGGATEYVHRVGRTARVGKGGEAWSFVAPSESEWVKWVEGKMQGVEGVADKDAKKSVTLHAVPVEDVLRSGFGGKGAEFEARATEVQLSFERWVLKGKDVRIAILLSSHRLMSFFRTSVPPAKPSCRTYEHTPHIPPTKNTSSTFGISTSAISRRRLRSARHPPLSKVRTPKTRTQRRRLAATMLGVNQKLSGKKTRMTSTSERRRNAWRRSCVPRVGSRRRAVRWLVAERASSRLRGVMHWRSWLICGREVSCAAVYRQVERGD